MMGDKGLAELYVAKFKKNGGLEAHEVVWLLDDLLERLRKLENGSESVTSNTND